MDLIDTTGMVSELTVGLDLLNVDAKLGCLSAKATFAVGSNGDIRLDSDEPVELFAEDTETPLGIFPSELPARRDARLEVWTLAAAYAPGGSPTAEMTVALRVGDRVQELRVIGDRHWRAGPEGAELSPPMSFTRMPLTWERSFGGSADVWVDPQSVTRVSHGLNGRGRGFDPSAGVAALSREAHVAEGFPRTDYVRLAPNIEDPAAPVVSPDDDPLPVGLAPPPVDCGIIAQRSADAMQRPPAERTYLVDEGSLRAAPGWVFDTPPLGQPVCLSGCSPEGGDFAFTLPSTVPVLDYFVGGREGSRDLTPQVLTLLPEERRFTMLYRHYFLMRVVEGEERSMRLRFG